MKWQFKTRWNCVALVRGWGGTDAIVQLETTVSAWDKRQALDIAREGLVEKFVADEKIIMLGVKRMKV